MLSWQLSPISLFRFSLAFFWCQFQVNAIFFENHSCHSIFTSTAELWPGNLVLGKSSFPLAKWRRIEFSSERISLLPSGGQCFGWLYSLYVCLGNKTLAFCLGPWTQTSAWEIQGVLSWEISSQCCLGTSLPDVCSLCYRHPKRTLASSLVLPNTAPLLTR